ncbi:hypothetical protein [Streptomyces sp. NPDC088246]|uniref:hypothetical protein n=1 Tax=Streptomyces sp. NPDC088246 TaxID=3365842 RepID=UPI00382585FB
MNFTRYRRPSAFLLTMAVALGAVAVAGLESGDEGALVLLLGWLALAAMTGAVLLGLTKSSLRVPLVTTLLVIGDLASRRLCLGCVRWLGRGGED